MSGSCRSPVSYSQWSSVQIIRLALWDTSIKARWDNWHNMRRQSCYLWPSQEFTPSSCTTGRVQNAHVYTHQVSGHTLHSSINLTKHKATRLRPHRMDQIATYLFSVQATHALVLKFQATATEQQLDDYYCTVPTYSTAMLLRKVHSIYCSHTTETGRGREISTNVRWYDRRWVSTALCSRLCSTVMGYPPSLERAPFTKIQVAEPHRRPIALQGMGNIGAISVFTRTTSGKQRLGERSGT